MLIDPAKGFQASRRCTDCEIVTVQASLRSVKRSRHLTARLKPRPFKTNIALRNDCTRTFPVFIVPRFECYAPGFVAVDCIGHLLQNPHFSRKRRARNGHPSESSGLLNESHDLPGFKHHSPSSLESDALPRNKTSMSSPRRECARVHPARQVKTQPASEYSLMIGCSSRP